MKQNERIANVLGLRELRRSGAIRYYPKEGMIYERVGFSADNTLIQKIKDQIYVTASSKITFSDGSGFSSWDVSFITEGAASGVRMNPFGNIIEYSINYSYIRNSDGTTYTKSFMLKGNVIPVREKYSWYEFIC